MKKLLKIFWVLDKKIWGDRINTNPYFATLCFMTIALLGAIQGAGRVLDDFLDLNIDSNPVADIGFCAVIMGLNIFESIIASADWKAAVGRSLYCVFAVAVIAVLGYALSALVVGAVLIIVVLWLLATVFSMVVFGGPDKGTITDSFGRKVKLKKDWSGNYTGDDGNTYKDNRDGTVTKE